MNKLKIAVIGIGGRTGTMFAFELSKHADVLGVGREKEVEMIKNKQLYVQRNQKKELFDVKSIKDTEFNEDLLPDAILIASKNPVGPAVKYYFGKFRNEKIPSLILSQNGIDALSDAQKSLKEIFGERAEKIRIIRCVLFNPIDQIKENNNIYIKYSLPVKLAISGDRNVADIFKKTGFQVSEFPKEQSRNLEFSKLFLNLIGMASASRGLTVSEGFADKAIFKEEAQALKEYVEVVKKSKGKFLNFPGYPVKSLALFMEMMPIGVLVSLRGILINFISKKREGKLKDVDEIEYYNGAVVRLGKKIGVRTLINEKIVNILKGS